MFPSRFALHSSYITDSPHGNTTNNIIVITVSYCYSSKRAREREREKWIHAQSACVVESNIYKSSVALVYFDWFVDLKIHGSPGSIQKSKYVRSSHSERDKYECGNCVCVWFSDLLYIIISDA